ncbi:MAG TPA: sugar transferase [Gemmatimonadales bacterium]|nr:sugar transferase [Gemmatimonadales bacterium]
MEAVPDIRAEYIETGSATVDPSISAPSSASPAPSVARPSPRTRSRLSAEHLRIRLGLQQRAAENIRRHLFRASRRLAVLLAADVAAVCAVGLTVSALRESGLLGPAVARAMGDLFPPGRLLGGQYLVAFLLGLYLAGNYGAGDQRRGPWRLFAGVSIGALLQMWSVVWGRGFDMVAVQYGFTALVVWGVIVAERLTLDWLVARAGPPDRHAARTLFVGQAEDCREAATNPTFRGGDEYARVGFLDLRHPPAGDALGQLSDLPRVLHDQRVETVVVCGFLPDRDLQEVVNIALAAGCQLLAVPRSVELANVHPSLIWSRGHPLMDLSAPMLKGPQLVLKRVVDLIGATLGLILLSPVMLLVAAAVKLDSRGPVFFRQERIGVGGRRFWVWKFRTMFQGVSDEVHRDLVTRMLAGDEINTAHAAHDGTAVFKLVNDARVTEVGRFLRRTSLDELPQLFNVLRGEMSLVGPRPPVRYEFEAYDHWQFDRLRVRPGITGLWQVSGRNRLSYLQMCELDVEYVRHWSIGLDLRILLRTIPVVLLNSGRAA